MSDFQKEIRESVAIINDAAGYLDNLSSCLYASGNVVLSQRLVYIYDALYDVAERIEKANSAKLTVDVRQAEESSGLIVKAALAGIEMSRKEDSS